MKTNSTKRIVVSVLALAMGAGLAGSISGSVAWYQYSTRVSAAIAGTSAGTVRELLICDTANGEYSQHVSIAANNFKPTTASLVEDVWKFYEHPVYKNATLPLLTNLEGHVYDYDFYFKCMDNDVQQAGKKVYLTYLGIENKSTGDNAKNITAAVRVSIGNKVYSLAGGATATSGQLDLNGKGGADKNGYDTNDVEGSVITYQNAGGASYNSIATTLASVDSTDPYEFKLKQGATGNLSDYVLTTTTASGASEKVTIRVWLEGWEKLGDPASSLWSTDWIAQDFEIQLQFACEAEL